ncbi:MAG: exodeoxyribonuclease III [Oscillospiraceae bacterium]|nr:exodeoxyribonuclease III [Oscillospiraceae bacterium]
MKLISWNVNGLRACLKKGFLDSFSEIGADIFCVQETKMEQGQAEIDLSGAQKTEQYHEYWNSADKKGYSGTAIFTKLRPLAVFNGIDIDEHDHEGRVITLDFEAFYLVNVYTPNSQRELARLEYRMRWEDAFREYVCSLDRTKPVIICGDLNCAHKEIDIKNAKSNERNAGFTIEERDKMTLLLESGFTDFFRSLNPDKTDAYTWWSYMPGVREKNVGWRIDYFLGSDRLTEKVTNAFILPDVYGSDHCPVGLEIDI